MRFAVLLIAACSFLISFASTVMAACSSPADLAGMIRYNSAFEVLQYCDDTNWIAMGLDGQNPGPYGGSASLQIIAGAGGQGVIDQPTDVKIAGNYAYVVSSDAASLVVVDISNPDDLKIVGTVIGTNMQHPQSVAIQGNYAYVTSDYFPTGSWLTIVDISDPLNPVELDSYSSANTVGLDDIVVSGNYSFANTTDLDGVVSFDISDPTNIVELDFLANSSTMDLAEAIAISGNYVFVVSRGAGYITAIDVSDPANLVEKDSHTSAQLAAAYDLDISGNYAFVASHGSADRVTAVDISDPNNLVQLNSITAASLNGAWGIRVVGNYAYVAADTVDSLTVVDVSDPNALVLKDTLANSTTLDRPKAVDISGDNAFVAGGNSSTLTAVNVSDVNNLVERDHISSNAGFVDAYRMIINNNYAYVIDQLGDSLVVLDISDPVNFSFVSTTGPQAVMDMPTDIALAGDYVYVTAALGDSITSIDITDPANPVIADTLTNANLNNSTCLAIMDNYAYICQGSSPWDIAIVNISDPNNLTYVTTFAMDAPQDITISGNFAYVADNMHIDVLDLTNPIAPTIYATESAFQAQKIRHYNDNLVFVQSGSGAGMLYAVDISEPSDPVTLDDIWGGKLAGTNGSLMALSGDYAYLANNQDEIVVVDISDPNNLVEAGGSVASQLTEFVDFLEVNRSYLYVGARNDITVMDIGNSGGCENPQGLAGNIFYNYESHQMEFCNGVEWAEMGVSPVTGGIDLSSALAGWWKLDESSGGLIDSSGNGNNGTAQGAPTYGPNAGIINGALTFDGVDDQVVLGESAAVEFTSGDNFTVSAWVKTVGGDTGTIVMDGDSGAQKRWGFRIDGGTTSSCVVGSTSAGALVFTEDWGPVLETICGVATVNDNQWHHVAWSRNGLVRTLYVDGAVDISGSLSASGDLTNIPGTDNFLINTAGGFYPKLNGAIDDVRIYNRALSATEIKLLGGRCSNPDARFGKMIYNTDFNTMQYCNGTDWIGIGK